MKRILLALMMLPAISFGQSFPSLSGNGASSGYLISNYSTELKGLTLVGSDEYDTCSVSTDTSRHRLLYEVKGEVKYSKEAITVSRYWKCYKKSTPSTEYFGSKEFKKEKSVYCDGKLISESEIIDILPLKTRNEKKNYPITTTAIGMLN